MCFRTRVLDVGEVMPCLGHSGVDQDAWAKAHGWGLAVRSGLVAGSVVGGFHRMVCTCACGCVSTLEGVLVVGRGVLGGPGLLGDSLLITLVSLDPLAGEGEQVQCLGELKMVVYLDLWEGGGDTIGWDYAAENTGKVTGKGRPGPCAWCQSRRRIASGAGA